MTGALLPHVPRTLGQSAVVIGSVRRQRARLLGQPRACASDASAAAWASCLQVASQSGLACHARSQAAWPGQPEPTGCPWRRDRPGAPDWKYTLLVNGAQNRCGAGSSLSAGPAGDRRCLWHCPSHRRSSLPQIHLILAHAASLVRCFLQWSNPPDARCSSTRCTALCWPLVTCQPWSVCLYGQPLCQAAERLICIPNLLGCQPVAIPLMILVADRSTAAQPETASA